MLKMKTQFINSISYLLLLIAVTTFFPDSTNAETIINTTTLSENTTWTQSGSPYLLRGDLTIPAGVTLLLLPGTQILIRPGYDYDILVNGGTLLSQGTESSGVLITREGTTGETGQIYVYNGGTLNMAYTEVSFANDPVYSSGSADSPNTVLLDHCNIHDISAKGISLSGNHSDITLTNNIITSNDSDGLYISGSYDTSVYKNSKIEGNTFSDNLGEGISISDMDFLNVIISNTYSNNATDGIVMPTCTLNTDLVWGANGIPDTLYLRGDLTIPAGVTLTLLPGTQILIRPGYDYDILVNGGTLLSQGTESSGVLITREGATGETGQIYVYNGGTLNMTYTEVSFANDPVYSSGSADSPNTVLLDHCNIHDISAKGISLSGNHSDITLTNNIITSNDSDGLYISGSYDTSVYINSKIEGNTFSDNLGEGISISDMDFLNVIINNTYSNNATDGIVMPTCTLDTDLVWGANGIPDTLYLRGDLTIPAGVTLTLLPGTQILIRPGYDYDILVNGGTLLSQGTESSGVLITREGATGETGQIYVYNGGTLNMTYTEVSFANDPVYSSGSADSSNTVLLDHCNIHDISAKGISLSGNHSDITLTNNIITSNDSDGLYISGSYDTSVYINSKIEGNTFSDNLGEGISISDMDFLNVIINNTYSNNATDGIVMPTCTLDTDLVWGANGIPDTLYLRGDLTIPAGVTLTLLPGTQILIRPGYDYDILVNGGTLLSQGTEISGVLITREGTTGETGQIYVYNGGTLNMTYTEVSFANDPVYSSGSVDSPNTVLLDHCNIHDISAKGISLSGNHDNISISSGLLTWAYFRLQLWSSKNETKIGSRINAFFLIHYLA